MKLLNLLFFIILTFNNILCKKSQDRNNVIFFKHVINHIAYFNFMVAQ